MPLKINSAQLVAQAMSEVKTYCAQDIKARLDAGDQSLQLVDIRDIRELQTPAGTPLASTHAPRGMLEFWIDPESKYYRPMFGDESKEFVLFCALGWRSALTTKTLQDMGMPKVAHVEGGFEALQKAGVACESLEQRKARKSL